MEKQLSTIDPQWYKKGWGLGIKNQSWVEDTENQVAFIIKTLGLTGKERVLDLACGYGRHALSLARKGYSVVGVDITKDFIDDARKEAKSASLAIDFIQADIRELSYQNEFDAVLNLADGAIGYLENDAENLEIFDIIARALKPGGKHFMDICNAEHAEAFFPKRHWEIGSTTLSLPGFDWDKETRRMLFSDWSIPFGEIARKPDSIEPFSSTRLYSRAELDDIFQARGMAIVDTFADYYGKEASYKELQLMVYSRKVIGNRK
ncbi:MAG TPA: class I SAM-dependent methyltransferase [Bacillota bacterium]